MILDWWTWTRILDLVSPDHADKSCTFFYPTCSWLVWLLTVCQVSVRQNKIHVQSSKRKEIPIFLKWVVWVSQSFQLRGLGGWVRRARQTHTHRVKIVTLSANVGCDNKTLPFVEGVIKYHPDSSNHLMYAKKPVHIFHSFTLIMLNKVEKLELFTMHWSRDLHSSKYVFLNYAILSPRQKS